ncbi:U-scoloptoxin(05)-Sm1a [Zophobas morio]|uniref:U-scoloptoxin(05)-Sm1a n=1 Tax=Zophobas morio TaxID=2755281 RepID=UPI003082C6B5
MKFCVFSATLVVLLRTSVALNCYQCSGSDPTKPFQCNEWLSSDIDIQPQTCDNVYDAKYCIKHTGRFEGGIGAKRFCSSLDLGNYCNYVKQPGDILTYRTCVYTCSGDGCNPSSRAKPTTFLIFVPTLVFLYKLMTVVAR